MQVSEQITRYILSKSHYSKVNRTVKYAAYLPAPNGETSVYRTSELAEADIWDIGQEYVAQPREKTLYAKGYTTASVIINTGLSVVPETTPHPLHANILSWPSEKHEQKMLALEIANQATLTLHPDLSITASK